MTETLRAAWVIGRRDFTAIIFSKAFIFFLIGPLFPVIVGVAAGALGGQVSKDRDAPVIGVALPAGEADKLIAAREILSQKLGSRSFPEFSLIAVSVGEEPLDARQLLQDRKSKYTAILTGSLEKPILTGSAGAVGSWQGKIAMLAGFAQTGDVVQFPSIETSVIQKSTSDSKDFRQLTGRGAQVLLFMLTTLLAGMVLSNLVEEKSNKIIEILAASIPMDAVFIGKLFAMLAMAALGICVWFGLGALAFLALGGGGLPAVAQPAVGWPIFLILSVIYFALSYLMLGSIFLGIGAQAATVREVQTLSMPATMLQLVIFFFAMYSVTKLGEPIEQAASIFPLSSPLSMIARAAQVETLWHHGVAIVGQIFFALLVLRISVTLFRRNVMKSGKAPKNDGGRRKLFGLIPVGR